jgi:cell division initiation protein
LKVTPIDVRNQKFGKALRGYDQGEVDAFLDVVSSSLEELITENAALKKRLSSAESTLAGYRDLEGNLKRALVSAQKSADEIRENAYKEAQLLMRETQMKAEKGEREAHESLSGLKKQITDLENLKRQYMARLRSLAETNLRILESMEKEDESYKEELQWAGARDQSEPSSDEETEI